MTRKRPDYPPGYLTLLELSRLVNTDVTNLKRWRLRGWLPQAAMRWENGVEIWSPEQVQAVLDRRSKKHVR